MAPHKLLDFVSNVANEVAQEVAHLLPEALESLESSLPAAINNENGLDISYVTDRILATSKPAEAPIATRNDTGRGTVPTSQTAAADTTNTIPADGEANQPKHLSSLKPKAGVNPGTLSTFLSKRHGKKFLAINLTEEEPDDRTLLLLNRQVITKGWSSPCIQKSETPCLPHILDICYTMHAFLSLDPQNVVLVYCSNGRTRTAIVIAAYLKFCKQASSSLQGFQLFLSKRCPHLDPNATLNNIPPSLLTFFRNFDNSLALQTVMNPKPLLLRAIAVQGVPVDDKPCIDIWDSSQQDQHVYASNDNDSLSQWADEEGFYRVNRVLQGDFCLLCRFGGPYMDETNDPSKVLFRYANTTGFLASGPYELPKSKVDMMRRYVSSFDEEDFSLTLLMESYWDCTDDQHKEQLEQECDETVMPPVLQGRNAKEKGWHLITTSHAARPQTQDVETLVRAFPELQDCPLHICKLALQLTNFDLDDARIMLCTGSMKSWWRQEPSDSVVASERVLEEMETENDPPDPPSTSSEEPARVVTPVPGPKCMEILSIMDEVEGAGVSHSDGTSRDRNEAPPKRPQHQTQRLDDPSLLYQGILFPNRGDIVNAFGDYYKQIHAQTGQRQQPLVRPHPRPLELGCKPRMPLIPRKRIRPPQENRDGARKRPSVDPFGQIGGFQNPGGANGDLAYDEDFMAAMEIYQQINHTGVSLQDLRDAQVASREWNNREQQPTTQVETMDTGHEQSSTGTIVGSAEAVSVSVGEPNANVALIPSDTNNLAVGGAPGGTGVSSGVSAAGVLSMAGEGGGSGEGSGGGDGPVRGAVSSVGNAVGDTGQGTDPSTTGKGDEVKAGNSADAGSGTAATDKSESSEGVPLKLDPEYQKYFSMLKVGLPMDAVKHAMKRDDKDPSIMDLDHDKSLKSQLKEKPDENVETKETNVDDGPALKDDPEYAKYFKMLKMGLPMDAVKHAMKRDEKDPSIMDLDHDKSLKSQQEEKAEDSDGPPLGEDPEYVKYWKMLKMGLPAGAVKNALQRDGKDPSIIDLDPKKSLKSQSGGVVEEKDDGPPLCDDPQFTKYFKMLKMGLPVDAVKNALQRDGKDPTIMDLDHNKSLKSQTKNEVIDTGIALKDDPEFAKYFKMLKMGLPMGAVKNALQRDEKDPTIMDLDPDKSVAFQLSQKSGRLIHRKKEKKRVRRKKIYWTPIDPGKVNEESIWSMVRGSVEMDKLKYDPKEFENLFTESSNPADKKKAAARKDKSKQQKKAVQVIDGKRSMNGGIILARLKMKYSKIAEMVDVMDSGKFDSTQLSALKEFLPTSDERKALEAFMKKGESSSQAMTEALSGLSECEKYMVAMMKVDNAAEKFDCMLFRVQFKGRVDELIEGINIVNKACEEVRSSDRLRKMMAMILTLVNQINTGGDGNLAVGFSLDALLKLNEAKAFDKKTSVLQYLVKLVKENDESLMDFRNDIESVAAAGGVILEALGSDVKVLADEVKQVHETAKAEADRLEAEGKLRKMTLGELSEQITVVRQIGGLSHYNQIDHITGRTQMERFASRATSIIDNAVDALEDLKKTYIGVLAYFGEDEQMASNDFFGTMNKFSLEFKSAAEAVEKQEKAKLKEKLRAAAKKAVAATRVANVASLGKGKLKASGKQMMGDIASMAASQAKLKRSGKKDEADGTGSALARRAKTPLPAGGIAAMAAAAALKKVRSSGQGDKEDGSSGKEGTESGAGIAAAAALAARNRSNAPIEGTETSLEKPSDPSPLGGIAAAAALAARSRSSASVDGTETNTKKPSDPSPLGGIAAAAALAAMNRQKEPNDGRDSSLPAMGGGGIAAMAAQAARSRDASSQGNTKSERSDDGVAGSSPPAMGGGGIAALAAQAARNRQASSQGDSKPESEQSPNDAGDTSPPAMGGGGIAALAAQAARNRQASSQGDSKPESEQSPNDAGDSSPPAMGGGGIAALAAAAARNRQAPSQEDQPSGNDAELYPPVSGGGIAALAAQAAQMRHKASQEDKPERSIADCVEDAPPAISGGGIAALAAQVARNRQAASQDGREQVESGKGDTEDTPPAISGGGIAALATEAARKRQLVHEDEQVEESVIDNGGIAALAAQAARDRQTTSQGDTELAESNKEDTEDAPPAISGGGIAALAAQAARKRQAAQEDEKAVQESVVDKPDSPISGGGIAALAAQAARNRQTTSQGDTELAESGKEDTEDAPPAISGGGIAALAAQAARKRQAAQEDEKAVQESVVDKPDSPISGGGIAALAAQAARNRQTASTDGNAVEPPVLDNVESAPSFGGVGIAAMAAAAARERQMASQEDKEAEQTIDVSDELPTSVSNRDNRESSQPGDFEDAVTEDAQGRLKVESDDYDKFFAAEESLGGTPPFRESLNVDKMDRDAGSSGWLDRHLPRSFSSRSHETKDLAGSPQGLKKTSSPAPVSPMKGASPKSTGGLSRWMGRFASQADSEMPAAPDLHSSASLDSAGHQSYGSAATCESEGESSSPGRKSPLQRIMRRSHGKRNLSLKQSKGKDEQKGVQQWLSDVDSTSGEFGA